EMPKLSPAATDPSYSPGGRAPVPHSHTRDAASVRPEAPAANRSTSIPEFRMPDITPAALEDARTVPVPPSARPAAAIAPRSTSLPDTGSTAAPSDPTPAPGRPVTDAAAKRPAPLPGSHLGRSGHRVSPSDLGKTPGKSVLPPLRPSAQGTMRL